MEFKTRVTLSELDIKRALSDYINKHSPTKEIIINDVDKVGLSYYNGSQKETPCFSHVVVEVG